MSVVLRRASSAATVASEMKKEAFASFFLRPDGQPHGSCGTKSGAGNETRTRDPDLGKVVLYQLSYSRIGAAHFSG